MTTNEAFKNSCTANMIYVDYKDLSTTVKPGGFIYMDDGLLCLEVRSCIWFAFKFEMDQGR